MMSHSLRLFPFRRFWKPTVATGVGGTAVAVWFEEILMFAEEILALVFVFITAGVVYLLDLYIFKSRLLKREDLPDPKLRGGHK